MVWQFFLVDPILARKLVQPGASAGNDPTGGTSSARLAGTGSPAWHGLAYGAVEKHKLINPLVTCNDFSD